MADNRNTRPAQQNGTDTMPLKPDGTPYTIEEIRQIQAYRRAMAAKRTSTVQRNSGSADNPHAASTPQPARSVQNPHFASNGHSNRQIQARPQPRQPEVTYRRRKPDKPNPAVLLFVVVAVAISVIGILQIVKNQSGLSGTETKQTQPLPNDSDTMHTAGSATVGDGDTVEAAETIPVEPEMLWNTVTVAEDELWKGALILVNYEHAYPDADTIAVKTVYGNKSASYQISNTSIALTDEALTAMNAMADAFYADTGSAEMIIVSGYRNVEDQRRIYNDRVASQGEELAALYVATPSYSEHHTGLAMDLSFYTTDGKSVAIEDHAHGAWINEHCAEYGFVLRYPSDKIDITKIGYESWHYRYVGIPHATIMSNHNLCLEEYIEHIKQYTPDTQFLWLQSDGSVAAVSPDAAPNEGYLVYYVKKSAAGATAIQIPRGNRFQNYSISGNNMDGYIVTISLG